MTKESSTIEIEDALEKLLDALIEHRAKRRANVDPIHATRASEIFATPLQSLRMQSFAADPIGHALRRGVREAGEHLFAATGSTKGMLQALQRVAERKPEQYSRRGSIMDHAWDGLGNDTDFWTT